MSDKQIGEYPLNIKIVSGSYEIANIDISVPIHVDPNERKYQPSSRRKCARHSSMPSCHWKNHSTRARNDRFHHKAWKAEKTKKENRK